MTEEQLAKVAAVYAKHNYPAWLGPLKKSKAHVMILNAGQYMPQGEGMTIEGEAPASKKEQAEQVKKDMDEALAGAEFENEIKSGLVGNQFTGINGCNKVFGGEKYDVTHTEGEVMLLDFWATWCPPCQAPMAHNQQMLEEHGERWGGKVRIIGASIDNGADAVKSHVESKGWGKVEHYHVRNGTCTADKEYGVAGVPHCLLVNASGKIIWMGHPASRKDLVKDFDDMLAGKTPEGIVEAVDEEGAAPKEVEGVPVDDAYEAAVAKWQETAKAMMEGNKAEFKFQRAFLVLEDSRCYDSKNGVWKAQATCHMQLVGNMGADVDKCKALLESASEGPWEKKPMYRV